MVSARLQKWRIITNIGSAFLTALMLACAQLFFWRLKGVVPGLHRAETPAGRHRVVVNEVTSPQQLPIAAVTALTIFPYIPDLATKHTAFSG